MAENNESDRIDVNDVNESAIMSGFEIHSTCLLYTSRCV